MSESEIIESNKYHKGFKDRPLVYLFKCFFFHYNFLRDIVNLIFSKLSKTDIKNLKKSFEIYEKPKFLIDVNNLQKGKFNVVTIPVDADVNDVLSSFCKCLNNENDTRIRQLVMMSEYCSSTPIFLEMVKSYYEKGERSLDFLLHSETTIFYLFNVTRKMLKKINKIPACFVFFKRMKEIEVFFKDYDCDFIGIKTLF